MTTSSSSTGAIPKTKFIPAQKEVNYADTLHSRYTEALQRDLCFNESEQGEIASEINRIHDVMVQLEKLSQRPEWPDSFVQVNPNAYIPATLVHTGEYYVNLGQETYTLMSLKETLGFLQRKLDSAQKVLDGLKSQQRQLEERGVFSTDMNFELESQDMPAQVTSHKGVAHKTASGFYEVIETYNEKDEEDFYRIRREHNIRKGKQKRNTQDSDYFFQRLEELQREEDLRGELNEGPAVVQDDDRNISERVKIILKQSGLYHHLLKDKVIQRHCHEHKTALEVNCDLTTKNESILNELIVEALINEPVYSVNDDFNSILSDDYMQDISSNDLAASAYLDSIENDFKNWNL